MRKRKITYISKHQLQRYGFVVDPKYKTDLRCYRHVDGIGDVCMFNYDYYTVRPDIVLIIDINGTRVSECKCTNFVKFQKIMKKLKINKLKYGRTTNKF